MSTSPLIPDVLAQAAARRLADTTISPDVQLMEDHEKRQKFRRLIDPGIFRPNSREIAMNALKTLSTIAENILREPDNPKYHSFKAENNTIKRLLIQPKGTLEYALELGFRPQVMEFQPHYVFHPRKIGDLRIGAGVLKEALERETEKQERAQRSRQELKAAEAAIAENVKAAFMDDRRIKRERDQRERRLREVRGSQGVAPALPSPDQSPPPMPGPGHTLASVVQGDQPDQPPPYQA